MADNRVWVFNRATRDVWSLCRDLTNAETRPLPVLDHVLDAPRVQQEPELFMVTLNEEQWEAALDMSQVARQVIGQGPLPAEDQAAWTAALDHDADALRSAKPDGTGAAISDLMHVTKDGPILTWTSSAPPSGAGSADDATVEVLSSRRRRLPSPS